MSSYTVAKARKVARKKRHSRIRKVVWGTAERPRLVVHRSHKNIGGQLIDDVAGKTIVGLSTLSSGAKSNSAKGSGKIGQSHVIGKLLAEKAVGKGVSKVVFDRAGYRYHGRVKAFAEGAREAGLAF